MIVDTYWGQPSLTGSLCHLREYINRLTVDRKAKTFSIADEFVLHTFRAHVLAAICDQLHIQSPSDPVAHDPTLEWLEKTATSIVDNTLTPPLCASEDPVYGLHRSFLQQHSCILTSDKPFGLKMAHILYVCGRCGFFDSWEPARRTIQQRRLI